MTKIEWDNTTKLLKRFAKPVCKKCYGRGFPGREVKRDVLITCKCIDKKELVKEIQRNKLLKAHGR